MNVQLPRRALDLQPLPDQVEREDTGFRDNGCEGSRGGIGPAWWEGDGDGVQSVEVFRVKKRAGGFVGAEEEAPGLDGLVTNFKQVLMEGGG